MLCKNEYEISIGDEVYECKCEIPVEVYYGRIDDPVNAFLWSFYHAYIDNKNLPIIFKDVVDKEANHFFRKPSDEMLKEIYSRLDELLVSLRVFDRSIPADYITASFIENITYPHKFSMRDGLEYMFKEALSAGYELNPANASLMACMYMDCEQIAKKEYEGYYSMHTKNLSGISSVERRIAVKILKFVQEYV